MPIEHPKGTTILVLGILSLVCCSVLGPVAWVMGHNARAEMNAQPGTIWSNRGNITAGWILGIIGTVALILFVLYFVVVVGVVASSNG